MPQRAVPMIHVPDVKATMEWYRSIGFNIDRYNEDDGNINWALLSFGSSEIMLDEGGQPSSAHRREVDLYVQVEDVAEVESRLKARVDVVEYLHDTFYGMREFIIRDLNRFWITFGRPIES
jgi:hypothetical protein